MHTDRQAEQRIAAALAQSAGAEATAAQVSDEVVAAWRAIDAALRTVVGQRGVAALYRRSIHLACKQHGCLDDAVGSAESVVDTDLLKAALCRLSAHDAAATGAAVFQTFYELLTTLVGPSLTERLLRSVWANFLSGTPAWKK